MGDAPRSLRMAAPVMVEVEQLLACKLFAIICRLGGSAKKNALDLLSVSRLATLPLISYHHVASVILSLFTFVHQTAFSLST